MDGIETFSVDEEGFEAIATKVEAKIDQQLADGHITRAAAILAKAFQNGTARALDTEINDPQITPAQLTETMMLAVANAITAFSCTLSRNTVGARTPDEIMSALMSGLILEMVARAGPHSDETTH